MTTDGGLSSNFDLGGAVGRSEPRAAVALKARIDATTQGLAYQWAEVWLERNPGATAKELLLFLAERAEAARRTAIQAEMEAGKLDELEAAQLVDKYMDYRDAIIGELDEG
ncbi:hypothetical protein ACF061_00515 [Streptomyces sp. NPDC015220]|uniref:hypothetical protein n=1 Tax=Streptomyces sp. NPDC015220 TaxID=3364947 RepID=UPI0037016717